MPITKNEMLAMIYDPSLIQKKQLDLLAQSVGGDFVVSDPTNPFCMLLEATNATAAAAVVECNNIIRKKYPSLASAKDDIYHHLFEEQLTSVFASPAEVEVRFYVNVIDLKNSGYRPAGANYVETTIPKYTKVTILDIPLMILNDIVVKLYDNNTIFIEQLLNNDNNIAYSDIGTLEGRLYSLAEETPWIEFRTKAKQLNMVTSNKTVVASDGFKTNIPIEDKYCYAQVSFKTGTGGVSKVLPIMYNDEYIDPLTPCVFISPYEGNVLVRIPDVYLLEGMVAGSVTINIFTTKGKLYIPINKYLMDDFQVELGDTGSTPSSASIKNITLLANSPATIDGGVDSLTDNELRRIVIKGVTNTEFPITTAQLERAGDMKGYKIINIQDVITGRLFLALRSLPDISSNLVFAKQDVFFNTVKVVLKDVENMENVVSNATNFIIKSNSIFKENNGIVTLATKEQISYLNKLTPVRLMEHLETNKYFYNPFWYVIENNETYTNSRVYDLDNPDVETIRILNKNLNVTPRVNINQYDLSRISSGYRLLVTLAKGDGFEDLEQDSVRLQLKLPLFGGQSFAYIDGTYLQEQDFYEFVIETDMILDENDRMLLNNGVSELYTKKFDLNLDALIYTMSDDPIITDKTMFLQDEISNPTNEKLTVFTKEQLKLRFGTRLKQIYNRLYNVYGENKYKVYDHDLPLTYQDDVFKTDENGCVAHCNEEDADDLHEVEFEILHHKGDPVLDKDGEPIYKYRKGDTVLDSYNRPIVDQRGGVIRYIDMLLLEYEYFVANSGAYENYKKSTAETLVNYITNDMIDLNDRLLENTEVLYRSYKTCKPVTVIINNTEETIPYLITPHITLYLSNTSSLTTADIEEYKNIIGGIINRYIDRSVIKLEEIKGEIKTAIGNTVTGVKISNLDPKDSEIITIKDENVKLTLNKTVAFNSNNEYIVKYNIKLDIQYLK